VCKYTNDISLRKLFLKKVDLMSN